MRCMETYDVFVSGATTHSLFYIIVFLTKKSCNSYFVPTPHSGASEETLPAKLRTFFFLTTVLCFLVIVLPSFLSCEYSI